MERAERMWKTLPTYLEKGELSHKDKENFEALLSANHGDYKKFSCTFPWSAFIIQDGIEKDSSRLSHKCMSMLSTKCFRWTKASATLPASLLNLNLFQLAGDLVDGNRGLIEYSDLLKRPIDTYKYLLGACETGSVSVGPAIAYLDTVMIASSNELQLDAFKDFPDFSSFKAESNSFECPTYSPFQKKRNSMTYFSRFINKPIAPHVSWLMALWAVLTRLKKPNGIHYPPPFQILFRI